ITGTLRRIDAAFDGICLEQFFIDRAARYTVRCGHRRRLDEITIDFPQQLPGPKLIISLGFALSGSRFAAAVISSVPGETPAGAIGNFLVDILGFDSWRQVRCPAANRIAAHCTEVLIAVARAIHTDHQMRTKIRTLLSIAFPLLTSSPNKPRFF